jgi:hypothetical protein
MERRIRKKEENTGRNCLQKSEKRRRPFSRLLCIASFIPTSSSCAEGYDGRVA